ncbi:hypothetical protein Flavo103_24600 [Flavobacterium collinsii]|nr:hypothetical protein Flavo103_24600 [Flavobacterium collinsii]
MRAILTTKILNMRNFTWSFLMFFCLVFTSFSQTKSIEKGTYLSTNRGQKIKLNLLENNKYELILYSGDYSIKGDSLSFSQELSTEEGFDLAMIKDKNAKKVKVKFIDPSFYPFYIGTQKGSGAIQYQKLLDIKNEIDPEWRDADIEFNIDRSDFLYLVLEGSETETKLYKYALPKDVAEITIKYNSGIEKDLKISGFLDKKTNKLQISDKGGKNPLFFVNEKEQKPESEVRVSAIESQSIPNWTYPGKESLVDENFGNEAVSTDSIAGVEENDSPKFDFKLKIENNLKDAIAATKNSKTKFLVVYSDDKNPSAKADFDQFVKDREAEISTNMYDAYHAEFDVFNYYLASADDKNWLKKNKFADTPSVIVLNNAGDVLTSVKSTLEEEKGVFNFYNGFPKKLEKANAFYIFNKVIRNKKATDADLIAAFNQAAILGDYETGSETENGVISTGFKLGKFTFEKKNVLQIWKKVIENHQKDTKPNMLLVETILKEINNQGFYKLFFNEDRVFNTTDFLAIDYLIKHYDAIEATKGEEKTTIPVDFSLVDQISNALYTNGNGLGDEIPGKTNKNQTIKSYKKLIESGKGSLFLYKNYFAILEDEPAYPKEFNGFFNEYLSLEKGNPFERLDELYNALDSSGEFSFEGWNSLKAYFSDLCNSAAWEVVSKQDNVDFVKNAINWSEYSLIVTKNNPYYLDTLAQLYYKNGQKEKAIQTQEKALQYSGTVQDEETVSEMKEVLEKMQNGTY